MLESSTVRARSPVTVLSTIPAMQLRSCLVPKSKNFSEL